MSQTAYISPLGIDLRPLDRQSPDGLCEVLNNLRPKGPEQEPYWIGVPSPEEVGNVTDALSAHWYRRNRRGDSAIDETGSLERLVVLHDDRIAIYDPQKSWQERITYNLESVSTTRRASFAQVDDLLMISLRDTEETDTLILVDDTFKRYELERIPDLDISTEVHEYDVTESIIDINDQKGLRSGRYSIRAAWEYNDGSTSALQHILTFTANMLNDEFDGDIVLRRLFSLRIKCEEIETNYPELISGIRLYLAADTSEIEYTEDDFGFDRLLEIHNKLFYEIGSIDTEGGSIVYEDSVESLLTRPESVEDVNPHKVVTDVPFAYNKRFHACNASNKLNKQNIQIRGTGFGFSSLNIAIVVELKMNNAIYHTSRVFNGVTGAAAEMISDRSESISDTVAGEYSFISIRFITYPDRRAQKLKAYKQNIQTGNWELQREYEFTSSDRNNYAHFLYLNNDTVSDSNVEELDILTTLPNDYEEFAGRIYVSEQFNPFVYRFLNAYNLDSRITAMAVNTYAISTGQFGEYPLFTFTRDSVHALEQERTGAVLYARISKVADLGCVGRNAVTNVDKGIIFLSDEGLQQLSADNPQAISRPIDPRLMEYNPEDIALGFYNDRDIKELWVSAPDKTWCYSLSHGRWFTHDHKAKQYARRGNQLYAITSERSLNHYTQSRDNRFIQAKIRLRPFQLGLLDRFKRLQHVFLRHENNLSVTMNTRLSGSQYFRASDPWFINTDRDQFAIRLGSNLSYVQEIDFAGSARDIRFHSISYDFDPRQLHRRSYPLDFFTDTPAFTGKGEVGVNIIATDYDIRFDILVTTKGNIGVNIAAIDYTITEP